MASSKPSVDNIYSISGRDLWIFFKLYLFLQHLEAQGQVLPKIILIYSFGRKKKKHNVG